MTQNAYSNMETGKSKIDVERLYKFAEFYNKQITELLDIPDIVFDTNNKINNLVTTLEGQLKSKDNQIEHLLWENKELILQVKSLNNSTSYRGEYRREINLKGMALLGTLSV